MKVKQRRDVEVLVVEQVPADTARRGGAIDCKIELVLIKCERIRYPSIDRFVRFYARWFLLTKMAK